MRQRYALYMDCLHLIVSTAYTIARIPHVMRKSVQDKMRESSAIQLPRGITRFIII